MPDADLDYVGTSRDRWTFPGVFCHTNGWRLTEATKESMVWVGQFGGEMTLSRQHEPGRTTGPVDLAQTRREHREFWHKEGAGLVSVELFATASGATSLEVTTKSRQGMGFEFRAQLIIDEGPDHYYFYIGCGEGMTGVKEATVNSLRVQLGDPEMMAMLNATGATRRIPGMQLDPYDSAFDAQATYSIVDDPRLDEVFQRHPLAVIRSTCRRIRATWECPATANATRHPIPPSTGPRLLLSDQVLQELLRMANEARANQ
jgi:hypothetical protein